MTTVASVASAFGPAALTILRALNASAATVANVGGTPEQKAYGQAARILDSAAFHGLVAARTFPEWAEKLGPVTVWDIPGVSALAPPTATLDSDPYAFANRIIQVASAAAAAFGVAEPGAWDPALANSDPPPEWLVDTYNGVLEVCEAIPVIGWIVEALMWLVGGIASWFTSYADEVFATSRPTISPEAIQAALDLMAAVRAAFESVLQRAKGLGWSQGLKIQSFSQHSKSITTTATATAAASAKRNRQIAVVAIGTGAALALVWALMA